MNRFNSQIAIITGGAQGIGFAIAKRISAEGAKVWLFDTNESLLQKAVEQINQDGGQAGGSVVDITNESSVINGFKRVIAADSKIDIMINSAGIVGPTGIKTGEVHLDLFKQTIDVNLQGAFLMTKHALKAMMPNNYGRILLHCFHSRKRRKCRNVCLFSFKSRGNRLNKICWKRICGIRYNNKCTGSCNYHDAMVEAMDPGQVKYMTDKIPMKRCGELNEIASLAAWIVSR